MKDRPTLRWWKKKERVRAEVMEVTFAQKSIFIDAVDEQGEANWSPHQPMRISGPLGAQSKAAAYNNAVDRIRKDEYPHMKKGERMVVLVLNPPSLEDGLTRLFPNVLV
jgi:hypothetical protein